MNDKIAMVARILLGLIFLIFGSNGLVMQITGKGFLPMPPPSPEMGVVLGGILAMKYLMPLVKSIQVISALLLLSGKYIPLALTLLSPIVINILGIHLFVDLAGLPMALTLLLLMLLLFKFHWGHFKPLLKK